MKTSIIKKSSLISAAFGIALISSSSFVGCGSGDDNGTDADTTAIVQLAEGLGECSASNEGAVFWDESENKAYVCSMGNWVDDAQIDNSLSSEHNTDELSGSSKNDEMINNLDSLGSGISSNKERSSSSSGNGGLSSSTVLSSSSQKTISSSSKQDNASSSSNSKKTSSSSMGSKFANGELTDYRDGHTYGAVTIGSQTWMSENLNFASDSSFCYNNDEDNCTKYGRLYKWAAAVNKSEESCGFGNTCSLPSKKIQGVCPSEWHLPSKAEFETLISAIGGRNIAGKILKATTINGSDDFAFAALPAGYKAESEGFLNEGSGAYFWSSEEGAYGLSAYEMSLNSASAIAYLQTLGKSYAASIRCIKDVPWNPYVISSSSSQNISSSSQYTSSSSQNISSSSSQSVSSSSTGSTLVDDILTDYRDGKTYRTVKIGKQRWMAENLNYKISYSVCYDRDNSNCEMYGRLYRWQAAMGSICESCSGVFSGGRVRGACPERWHLPSKEEFETLIEAVGGIENASVLKSSSGWNENGNGSDTFMFSALPVGECNINSVECHNKGNYATFWSSTTEDYSAAKAYCFTLYAKYPAELDAATIGNSYGYSVRCVYDFER